MNLPKLQNLILVLSFGFTSLLCSQNKEIPLWETIPGSIETADYKETILYDTEGVIKGI